MGCSVCGNKSGGSSSSNCNGKTRRLRSLRVQLVTLFNTTSSNNAKRVEYRAMITDVDNLLHNAKISCPTHEDIVMITNYINNERNNGN